MIDSFDFVFLLLSMFSLITEDTRTVVLILLDMVLVSPDEKTGELFLPRSDHRKILPKVDQVYILADRLGIAVEKDKTFTRSEMQSLLHKILIPIWSQIDDEEHLEMLLTRFNAERFFKGSLELTKFFLQKSRGLLMRDERFKRWIPPPNEDHDLTSSWSNATVTQATFNASTRDHAQAHDYPTLRVQPDDSPTIASNIYYDTTNKSEARNPAILEDDCFTPNNKLNDAPTESQLTEGRAVSPHSDTRPSIDTAEPSANAGPDDRTQLTPDLSPRFVTEARSGNPDYLASVAPEAKNMMENIKSDTSSTKVQVTYYSLGSQFENTIEGKAASLACEAHEGSNQTASTRESYNSSTKAQGIIVPETSLEAQTHSPTDKAGPFTHVPLRHATPLSLSFKAVNISSDASMTGVPEANPQSNVDSAITQAEHLNNTTVQQLVPRFETCLSQTLAPELHAQSEIGIRTHITKASACQGLEGHNLQQTTEASGSDIPPLKTSLNDLIVPLDIFGFNGACIQADNNLANLTFNPEPRTPLESMLLVDQFAKKTCSEEVWWRPACSGPTDKTTFGCSPDQPNNINLASLLDPVEPTPRASIMELLFAAPVPCFLDNISNEAGKPQGTPASKRASHAISHLDIQAVAQVQGTQAKEDIETRENTQTKEVTPAQAALQTIVEDPEDIQPYQNAQFLESTQLQEGSLDTLPYLPSTLSIVSYASSTTRLWARTMVDWMETSPVASPLIGSSDYPTSWDVVGMTSNPGSPPFNMCEFNSAPLRIVKRKRDAKDLHPDTASSTNNDLSRALVLYSPPSVLSPFKPQRHASILDVLSPIRVDDTVKPGLVPTAPNDNPVACLEDHAPSLAQLASSLTLAFETLEIANNTGAVTMTPILTMSPSLGDGFDLGIDLCSSTPAMDSTPGMFAASVAPLNILKRTCETTKQKEGRPLDGAESVEIACPVDTSSPMDLTTSGEPAFTRDRAIEFLDYPRPPSSSGSNDSSIGVQTHVDAKVGLKKVLRRGVHNLKSIFDFKGKMANTSREPTPSLTYDSRDTSVEPSNVGTPDLSATNPILGYPGLDTSESYSIRSRGEIQNKETRPCKRKVKFPLLDTPNTIGDAVEQRLNRMILTSHRRNISIHRT